MKKIYRYLFVAVLLSVFCSSAFSQSPACANFSGVFISDSLEQNFADYTICNGSSIYLKSLNNPSGATFQWKKNGMNISGATSRVFNATSVGLYSLTLTEGTCTATSSGITINPSNFNRYFLNSYNSESETCIGDSIKLYLPRGNDVHYQWKKDNVPISGAPDNYQYYARESGVYSVQVTQNSCIFNSTTKNLVFGNDVKPFIQVDKFRICGGRSTTLRLQNYRKAYNILWSKNDTPIVGQNTDSLIVSQTGNYKISVSDGSCTGTTNAVITVDNLNIDKPDIIGINGSACQNNVVKLEAYKYNNYNDNGTLTWYRNGVPLAGQSGKILMARESGYYSYRYQGNEFCAAQSNAYKIFISNNLVVDFSSNDVTTTPDQSYIINYNFQGVVPITLRVNGVEYTESNPLFSGFYTSFSTTQTFIPEAVINACGVGNTIGSATITKQNCPLSTTVDGVTPGFAEICYGGSQTLSTLNAIGQGTLTYQWFKDGVVIPNSNSSSITISNLQEINQGYYSVKVTGGCGSKTTFTSYVRGKYDITVLAKLNFPAYQNNAISLSAISNKGVNNSSISYRWTGPNNFSSTLQNHVITNGATINNGIYEVTAKNFNSCFNKGFVNVNILPCPTDKTISVNSGNWNTNATWTCGQIPTPTLDAIIDQGHTVNLPNGYQGNAKKLELKGGIKQGVGASVRIGN